MPTEHQTKFAKYLESLAGRDNRAALAHLRRGLGKPPGTAPEMFPIVVPWTSSMRDWDADAYYVVAALFGAHPMAAQKGNFGDTCRIAHGKRRSAHGSADEEGVDSLERRFVAMLNAHPDDLQWHLRHAVELASGAEVPVNWAELLYDLSHWSHPDRFVQRKWANSYWRSGSGENAEEQPTE
ncbi:MAG: type I-E CRISPR-associated protein Cse2/CasB [candidate division WS1 bacterium]|jgi:CRISPR system Cascade subunit CasB|nr:type I-E CRISPR-associated protein Cse2/CasB [candidate division WS1 bacterium]